MSPRLFLGLVLFLNACMPVTPTATATRATLEDSTLPPMKTFSTRLPDKPARSNIDIAEDFLDLTFKMESGRELPYMTRFEGPITLRVTGTPPASLNGDLSRLLARLRNEARIDIRQTNSPDASITVQAVTRQQIRSVLPQAACFVAPNVQSLAEYRAARRKPQTNWSLLETREQLAIFLPNDASPQEARDCLHEELAQALGPLNDLYRLTNSVFNDDNVHTVLTSFDMLILRVTYAPELYSGMTREQAQARLPGILARLNPGGEGRAPRPVSETPQAWSRAILTALGPGSGKSARQNAANQAIRIATDAGWEDHRTAFAHYAKGRLLQTSDPEAARQHYLAADSFYARTPNARLHRAYVSTQLAAYSVSEGDGEAALRYISPYIDVAIDAENASLLATLLMLRAEALELTGKPQEARAVRLDSLGWARYGFGSDWAVRAKLREVANLNPQKAPV